MNNFEFNIPTKLLFGKNTINKIGKEISDFGLKKVLLLYGGGSIFNNGVYKQVSDSLKSAGIDFIETGGIKPNPVLSKVHEAIEICKMENVDAVLAVGGGSVIDSGKAIAAGALYDGDIWDAFEGKVFLKKALPLFSVLTLSATGSEMNQWAVITKENEKKKWAFTAGIDSFPKVSILDPSVQSSLPEFQTVNGASDILAHVFELYFDGTPNTDFADELSEGIIRTVMKNVKILLNDPGNYNARAELAWSGTMALNSINGMGRSGGDWATHSIEHSLSAYYDIAHGAGLSIIFPAWMKYVYTSGLDKFERFAENIFCIVDGTKEEKSLKAIARLEEFYVEIGSPTRMVEFDIHEKDIPMLTENSAIRGPIGKLKSLNSTDIEEIFKLAYK